MYANKTPRNEKYVHILIAIPSLQDIDWWRVLREIGIPVEIF